MAHEDPAPATGLTSLEARERLARFGPNAIPEERAHPVLLFLRKLWGPVPWMLEMSFVLELGLGRHTQATIIATLLLLNAALSFAQENRARGALALLRRRLRIEARVVRDGTWQRLPAEQLVPGDIVRVRLGDLVPADLTLSDGQVDLDRSTLTGESTPALAGPGETAFAGSVVRRGEATGEVAATGPRTYYGKTAELVRAASAPGELQAVIFTVVRYLVALDVVLVGAILAYGAVRGIPFTELLPFSLILLVASVPVALPATFTLANALGSLELSERGVLVTRLSAIQAAAAMDVLCSDKTGTMTENRLSVAALRPFAPHTEGELLRLAALASEEATQDPIDLAILAETRRRGLEDRPSRRLRFIPFEPATKRSEAVVELDGQPGRVIKGAPHVVSALAGPRDDPAAEVDALAALGHRVLAVASGPEGTPALVGVIGLQDPPRADAAPAIAGLRRLGVRVLMITGDGPETARAIAAQVGLGSRAGTPEALRGEEIRAEDLDRDLFAGVLPEDKFRLVQAFQRAGHVVGMTGDGVNDAPALRQAEVGIAVSNATDVAKAAAALVLTRPGLSETLDAVRVGRQIHQRMLTYTLNKITKTFQIALFLTLGLLGTGVFVTTPRLILLLLFANDFVTMSIAADRVRPSARPDRWDIRTLVLAALGIATAWLAFSFAVFFVGRDLLHLDLPQLQTLVFLMLVFTGQASVYLVRERGHLWDSRPGRWLAISSVTDVGVVLAMASWGLLMAPIAFRVGLGLGLAVVATAVALDFFKVALFRRLHLR